MTADAVILAAGRGSRLGPLTDNAPKCLMQLAGRSLLEHHVAALRETGLERIEVVTGYQAAQIQRLMLPTVHNPDWERTNMVASLLCARDALRSERDLIVGYGDIVMEPKVVAALLDAPGDIATVIDQDWLSLWQQRSESPISDAETLRMTADGRITEIGGKPRSLDEIQGQYIGLTKFTRAGKDMLATFVNSVRGGATRLPRPLETAHFTDLLQGLILAGHEVRAAKIRGGWLEIDTREDLALYEHGLQDGSLHRFFKPGMAEKAAQS